VPFVAVIDKLEKLFTVTATDAMPVHPTVLPPVRANTVDAVGLMVSVALFGVDPWFHV
jgi:hypothetical protein